MLTYLRARIAERSTWLGVGTVLATLATTYADSLGPDWTRWVVLGIGAVGIAAVLVPESKA